MEEKVVLTIEEAAEYLKISRPSTYQAAKKGDIPIIRIGRRILVPVSALEKMLSNAGADNAAAT
jgi:excisionase family DNA binding protein